MNLYPYPKYLGPGCDCAVQYDFLWSWSYIANGGPRDLSTFHAIYVHFLFKNF